MSFRNDSNSTEPLSGGYTCKFVIPPKELQFECSICLHIVKEPRLVSCCGYRFCSDCILRIEREGNSCPLCNESKFTTLPDKLLERTLKQKTVSCTYEDCTWMGLLSEFESHLKLCISRPIECPQRCGRSFLRSLMANHISQDCPETVVECEFLSSGCHTKLPRRLMPAHMKSSAEEHVTLLSKDVTDLKAKQEQFDCDITRLLDFLFVCQHSSPVNSESYDTFIATSTKVLVRGLPSTADEQKIKCVFGQAGRVLDINYFPSLHAATIEFVLVSSVTNLFKRQHERPFRLHSHDLAVVQLGGIS